MREAAHDPPNAGKGVAFLTPIKGADVRKAATAESLKHAEKLATLKVEGNDAPGIGSRITAAIADAGVNLRGVSGAVVGRKFVIYLGFDESGCGQGSARVLKALGTTQKSKSARRG